MSVPAGSSRSPVDDALDRLRQQINKSRATYVPGTPEKYPATELRGLTVLEAEALLAQAEQLREERDAARVGHRVLLDAQNELIERAEAAEAEVRRLREGLREADEAVSAAHHVLWASYDEWEGEHGRREPLNAFMWRLHEILRSLLSASPPDGGGA